MCTVPQEKSRLSGADAAAGGGEPLFFLLLCLPSPSAGCPSTPFVLRLRAVCCAQVVLLLVAGMPWHVCGAKGDEPEPDELPVVGVGAKYAAKKHTLNARGDEQIPGPPLAPVPPALNDEDALLAKALSDEMPMESLEEDSGYDEKYQPTYEYYDDKSADAEGQDESDGLEAVLQAERAYFIARDHDGDGELSKQEFTRQLNEVDPDDKEEWDTWNTSQRGRPAPSKAELMWGKDWTARVTADQVLECG